jgi:branched-chain amino acid transport system permease protein
MPPISAHPHEKRAMNWPDILLQGLLLGGLYALFAAGLSLVFGIMRLVNLAHGDMIILAAYLILSAVTWLGLSPWAALLLAMPAMFAFGWLLQMAVLNRVLGKDVLPPLLVTFGLSITIQNGLLQGFSADSRRIPAGALEGASLDLGIVTVGVMPLLTFVTAVLLIVALNGLFYHTALGRAFRATSDDPVTAGLMGIEPQRIFAVATGLAMVVVTLAALYLGMRANFDPSIGPARLLYAFEAVIIGGLGSFWGTLVGGAIIGLTQTIGAAFNPEWQILAGHIAFLGVLLIRPRGIFPREMG